MTSDRILLAAPLLLLLAGCNPLASTCDRMVGTWTSHAGSGIIEIKKSGNLYTMHLDGQPNETGPCVNGAINLPNHDPLTLANNGNAVSWLSDTFQKGN
jgi:hypothetical protein